MKKLIGYFSLLITIQIILTNCNTCPEVIMVDHIGYSDKYVPTCYISTDSIEIEQISDYFILVNQSKMDELKEYISNIDEKYSSRLEIMSWWDFHIRYSSCRDSNRRLLDGNNSIILFEDLVNILSDVEMDEYSRYQLTKTLSRIQEGMYYLNSQQFNWE